jgi:cell division protein FtsZ
MLDMEAQRISPARIMVIGLGGGGSNAVGRMIAEGLRDVTFWVANTDSQALDSSSCNNRLQLGGRLTCGLGAGGDPEVGRAAAEEDAKAIEELLEGYDMVFLTAGMGGGTGTGSIPVVARIARSMGALTVAIVTRPFGFENAKRLQRAEEGVRTLAEEVDTMIVIPNDKLLHLVERGASFNAGLRIADDVLFQATRGISDIIMGNGIINVDFADVRTVMRNRGAALLGCGIASGPARAMEASQAAVSSPLLEDLSIHGAAAILVNIVGGPDMGFHEVTEAAQYISEQAGKDCDVFWGAVVDPSFGDEMRLTLIATGFQRAPALKMVERSAAEPFGRPREEPVPLSVLAPAAPAAPPAPAIPPAPSWTPVTPLAPPVEPALPFPADPIGPPPREEVPVAAARISPFAEPDPRSLAGRVPPLVMPGDRGLEAGHPFEEGERDRLQFDPEPAERWVEETGGEAEGDPADRGPALWRRRPARRLRLPDRYNDFRLDGRNPLDIPTFLRKQMD